MNAYLVRIPEERGEFYSGGYEPPEPWYPIGVFVAATRAQAKADALRTWTHSSGRSGVYGDDWPSLRTNLLARDVALLNDGVRRGEYETGPLFDFLWLRVHEVLDHDGAGCSCPEVEVA